MTQLANAQPLPEELHKAKIKYASTKRILQATNYFNRSQQSANSPGFASCGYVTNGLTFASNYCSNILAWHHNAVFKQRKPYK